MVQDLPNITRSTFERWIKEAVAELPDELRTRMDNVAIVLDDESPPGSYLGLYHGIPKTHRDLGYSGVLPDKITIYQQAIVQEVAELDQLPEIVRRVVWHEIGHHFGLSDRRLRQLERRWQRRPLAPKS